MGMAEFIRWKSGNNHELYRLIAYARSVPAKLSEGARIGLSSGKNAGLSRADEVSGAMRRDWQDRGGGIRGACTRCEYLGF